MLFLLHDGGQFVEAKLEGTKSRSRGISQFWLDTTWLWQRLLPATRGIAGRILDAIG